MQTVTIDFETFWDQDYSLSKMSFIEYIHDPRFEVQSCSIKINDGATREVFGQEEVGAALREIDWANSVCVAHNGNEFDFPLLVWIYDCHPKLFVDTLCMARPKHQSDAGGSLAALSKAYRLHEKDNSVLIATKGRRLHEFTPDEMQRMTIYNRWDTENCYSLFKIFNKMPADANDLREIIRDQHWHKVELRLMDMTARMAAYPQFDCDMELLRNTLAQAEREKEQQLMSVAGVLGEVTLAGVKKALGSSKRFADALREVGVEPPTKISAKTKKEAYAFAKTDEAMQALLEHDDETVQILAAARLGVKSTLLETRIQKMLACAERLGGKINVPLGYHSATTGRWGGRVWNPQNLPRVGKSKKLTDALRMALMAPPGHKIVVCDLSQIELRVNHYLWGVSSTADAYANNPKADLYTQFAVEKLYHKPAEEIAPEQRQVAKVAQLGLGFGAAFKTFQRIVRNMTGIKIDADMAMRTVKAWREAYQEIVRGWTACESALRRAMAGFAVTIGHGCSISVTYHLPDIVEAVLPTGRRLYYPGLRQEQVEEDVQNLQDGEVTRTISRARTVYGFGSKKSTIYGALFDENLVQAIARDVISEMALTVLDNTGYYPALMVHDELVYVVPEDKAEAHLAYTQSVMRTPPKWLPGIVLWCEGGIADRYGEAK
jgi:DNA polymerase I-like protein with 3'-5' exonuclease and polymerase domains